MKQFFRLFGMLVVLGLSAVCLADVGVGTLKCEYREGPVGVDVERPRLSWVIESDGYDQVQRAYQVVVADSLDGLAKGEGICWDSGKVSSDASINVAYDGQRLASLQRYYWKVRVWDKDGVESPWSEAGCWVTGLMDPAEFEGKWISYSKPLEHEVYDVGVAIDLADTKWIWYPTDKPSSEFEAGSVRFSKVIEIEDAGRLSSADMLLTADDQFVLEVNGQVVGESDSWQQAKRIDLLNALKDGQNRVVVTEKNLSEGPGGLVCKIVLDRGGEKQVIVSDKTWNAARVVNGVALAAEAAKEIYRFGQGPWGQIGIPGKDTFWTQDTPSPLLRKEFTLKNDIVSCYAVVSGLGFYELRINGRKVGDKVLDPVFTNYSKTVLYSTYDVSEYVTAGDNAVGIMLGNGWYNSHTKAAWDFDRAPWRDKPKALMDLVVRYGDGTTERICTDETWLGANGPLVADAIRNGEVYDARLEKEWWDEAGLDESGWDAVTIAAAPKGGVTSEMMPATKVHETIVPVAITEPEEGIYLVDMGVNMAGWAKLTVCGRAGQKITMRYGEVLRDGKLDVTNIKSLTYSGLFQTDTYYLKGGGVEEWHGRFVYHGFRYVEVTGLKERPTAETIQGQVVYTDFGDAGDFACSNAMFNTIQEMTERSYKSNFVGIPTDCPQREKNGWTADAHLAAELAMLNFDNLAAYEKWLGDFRDDQDGHGRYSCIIPTSNWGARDLTEWDSAYMIIAGYLYQYCGDVKVIADNYENMKRYMANVVGRIKGTDYVVKFGLGDWANDGGSVTPVPLTASAYFYYDCVLMERFAKILGEEQDVAYYKDLAGKVKAAYNHAFYKGKGIYAEGQQTALAMSLYYGLVPEGERGAVEQKLVEAIAAKGNHHDTGILGAKCIFRVLCDMGRSDLAMVMLNQTTEPSYGYWIENGATSLYENWTKSPGSMNHIMYGDVSAWFYTYLGGIRADADVPGFKRFVIQPEFVDGIDWVSASHESPYGPIRVNWKIRGGQFVCTIHVPVNTEASVVLESSEPAGVGLANNQRVKGREVKGDRVVYTVGSGIYTFVGKR